MSSVVYDDSKIEFNDEGERINVAYDVVNYARGQFHVVGHMVGFSEITKLANPTPAPHHGVRVTTVWTVPASSTSE